METNRVEPFTVRFGLDSSPVISSDFPDTARIGLWHILDQAERSGRTLGWSAIVSEILRLSRVRIDYDDGYAKDVVYEQLQELVWDRVFVFCERIYSCLLSAEEQRDYRGDVDIITGIDDVRKEYEENINQLLAEENIVYRMSGGMLYRPGRLHSQRVAARANVILGDPRLAESRKHYVKAQRFFAAAPEPDFPNAVKEAVSSLEAAVKALFSGTNGDIEKTLRGVKDSGGDPIPPTILKGLLSVYYFRGAAEGVAHGGANGGKPTAIVTEWVLSCVASTVIYLRDLADDADGEIPPF